MKQVTFPVVLLLALVAPSPSLAAASTSTVAAGTSVPLWAVLLGALGLSCVLALTGEGLVTRARSWLEPKPARRPRAGETFPREERPPSTTVAPALPEPESIEVAVERLRTAAAALGYEDRKLDAVIDALTTSPEWRPLALATVLASWEEQAPAAGGRGRARSVSQSEKGETTMGGYADLGHRVAAVLHAAEEAAARIKEEAREEAAAITRDAEQAAAERIQSLTKEAEQLRGKAQEAVAEAEARAQARHEAAEATARRIEAEAMKHQEDLKEASQSVEQRLRDALEGLERVSSEVEQVLAAEQPPSKKAGKRALRGL